MDLIEKVLSEDERFYRGGDPIWEDAPAPHAAERQHEKFCTRLLKSKRRGAREVAARIERCARGNRCLSPDCPICARAAQRALVEAAEAFVTKMRRRRRLLKFDLVDAKAEKKKAVAALDRKALANLKRRATDRLASPLRSKDWVFGTIDISFNENGQGQTVLTGPHWMPHLGLVGSGPSIKPLRKAIRKKYRKTRNVDRPVMIQKYDGSNYGLSYACKLLSYRRVSYLKVGKRRTKPCELKLSRHVAVLIALNKLTFSDLCYQRGCRLYAEKAANHSTLRLEKVSSNSRKWLS